jgi:hypothetical protein
MLAHARLRRLQWVLEAMFRRSGGSGRKRGNELGGSPSMVPDRARCSHEERSAWLL